MRWCLRLPRVLNVDAIEDYSHRLGLFRVHQPTGGCSRSTCLTFGLQPLVKPYVRFSRIRLSCIIRLKLSEVPLSNAP